MMAAGMSMPYMALSALSCQARPLASNTTGPQDITVARVSGFKTNNLEPSWLTKYVIASVLPSSTEISVPAERGVSAYRSFVPVTSRNGACADPDNSPRRRFDSNAMKDRGIDGISR